MTPLTRRKIDRQRRQSGNAATHPPRSILEMVTAGTQDSDDDEDHLPLSVWKNLRPRPSEPQSQRKQSHSPVTTGSPVTAKRRRAVSSSNQKSAPRAAASAVRSTARSSSTTRTREEEKEEESLSRSSSEEEETSDNNDNDDDDSKDQDFVLNTRNNRSDDSDEDDPIPPPQQRRARTPKAAPRPRRSTAASPQKKPKRRAASSDEEYHTSDDDDEEEEDDDVSKDTDDRSVGVVRDDEVGDAESSSSSDNDERIGIVNDNDIGTKDDSSDDDDNFMATPSPTLSLKQRRHRNQTARQEDFSSSDSSDEDDPVVLQSSAHSSPNHCTMPFCPSTHDAITQEELPAKHICFFPPDGQSRECFALETLRTIALTSRWAASHSNPQPPTTCFLQPPHFRSPMSDDILDQIASRFGRAATNPNSEYYLRTKTSAVTLAQAAQVWSLTNNNNNNNHQDRPEFWDHVDRYVRKYMGNQDVYCCPLCYIVSHQQLVCDGTTNDTPPQSTDPRSDPLHNKYPTDFVYDPMTVLGYLDNSAFRLAATFCFVKVSQLKQHLRQDHAVDTQLVEGNEVYTRDRVCNTIYTEC